MISSCFSIRAPFGRGWSVFKQFVTVGLGLLLGCAAPSHQVRNTPLGVATAPEIPQMARSNESTEAQLNLARKQGYADELALKWLMEHASPASAQQKAGEYQVAYLLSAPEGWYVPGRSESGGQADLVWQSPAPGATAHLHAIVRDGADGRNIPGLHVRATFQAADGRTLASQELPYGWYPLLAGYGDNLTVPAGTYRLRLDVSRMPFRRHDPYNGDRLSRPVVAIFDAVPVAAALARQAPLADAAAGQQLLAQAQGDAFHQTTQAMYAQANDGHDKPLGDYHVGYAIEYAEAYWYFPDSTSRKLRYQTHVESSAVSNGHVEITVLEARTGRFLPGLHITGTVLDEHNQPIATHDVPFMWHPWLYHYGENWRVRGTGTYHLRIHADAPAYRRYGRTAGREFASAIDTEFDNVKITSGQK